MSLTRPTVLESAELAIGDTPLVELSRMFGDLDGRVLAKLEYLNPGFSKKDRVARQVIEDALADGQLQPGQTVVELTSGNTGTGLAIVCAALGHRFVAVMSAGNSPERSVMMRALGAEVVLVEQAPGGVAGQVSGSDLALVEEEAQRIVAERGAFRADQFVNQANFRAHYLHTGPEMWEQSGGRIDAFCDFVGTGGTFAGCAAAFKERNAAVRCYVVEPSGAAVLAGQKVSDPQHRIQGGGYGLDELPLMEGTQVDGFVQVTDTEAIEAARTLARREGIFAGYSSGANAAAARKLLQGPCKGGDGGHSH